MRCEIAASLLHEPKLLFLDEPTIGLDAVSKIAVRDFIKRMNEEHKTTVILTTHDMQDIEAVTKRVILIGKGQKLMDGNMPMNYSSFVSYFWLRESLWALFNTWAADNALFAMIENGDVLLCFSIIQMSFTFAELFGNGFKVFSGMVRRGEFDRMMLRPCSLILQVIGTRFEVGRMGPLLTAFITLALGIRHSQIIWNIMTIWTITAMIIGGTLLFIGLFMLEASFCFFSIEDTSLINVLTYGAKTHGKYPIDIYGKGIMRFCTYVIPYTLIQYYPLQFLLGKTHSWYMAFCPLGIIAFLLICYAVWQFGVKHYKSCGS